MRTTEPKTRTLEISELKDALSSLVDAVSGQETRVLIEKYGSPLAALVSADDLERLQQPDREWETTTRALERICEAFADVPVEDLEAKIDEIIAAERAHEARFAVIDRMRAAFADVAPEEIEIERESERTVAEARERIRQRTTDASSAISSGD